MEHRPDYCGVATAGQREPPAFPASVLLAAGLEDAAINYYEHHIGDYDKSTAHLTACEDGIYCRLLRRYYDTELPLPLDVKAVQRLVRARSREEREAVETILAEFFTKDADGWRHGRCDEEIARYAAKREKARRSAEARWAQSDGDAKGMRTHSERNANASPEHDERNALQSPDTKEKHSSSLRSDSSPAVAEDRQAEKPGNGKVAQLQQRLVAVTDDAIATFNERLGKPHGRLPRVALTTDVRRKEVKRCLTVAKAICAAMYGSERIDRQFWVDYWTAVDADDFHAGRLPGGKGHENWTPDFEFLTRPDVMAKLFDRAVSAVDEAQA